MSLSCNRPDSPGVRAFRHDWCVNCLTLGAQFLAPVARGANTNLW
jgi:hypothetical protein